MDHDAAAIAPADRFQANEPGVVADVIHDETLIMNLDTGDYYSLNPATGVLWNLVVAGVRRGEIRATVARRHGLVELPVILRRHTPAIRAFNEAWWSEIVNGSRRDQLSFNYVAWRLNFDARRFRYQWQPRTGRS